MVIGRELIKKVHVGLYEKERYDADKDYYDEVFSQSSLSDEFDSTDSQAIFKMFLDKIADGTLEMW